VVLEVELMNAQFVPALTTGVVPTIQLSVDEFATVHPLAVSVVPFSKPPSPVGEIKVVCPHPFPTEKKKTISNEQISVKFRTKKRLGVNSIIADFKGFNPFLEGLK
jgi:hypothetical protein